MMNTLANISTVMKKNIILIIALIAIGIIGRIMPHPYNFTPIIAIALLSAHAIKSKWIAITVPLVSFWVSDLIINNFIYAGYYESFKIFTPGMTWIYGSIICISFFGKFFLNKLNLTRLGLSSILGSTIFFLISNFGVWMTSAMYTKSFLGLIQCYTLAIPFFGGSIIGDLVYSTVLFSSYSVVFSENLFAVKLNNQN